MVFGLPGGLVTELTFLHFPSLLFFIFRFMVPGSGLPWVSAGSLNDLILGMHVSPIVDGRNPKQPPGMYPKPCKQWDKLPTSTG